MKKDADTKFYENLDERIKNIISLNEFLVLERKNKFDCEFYKNLIDKISEITNFENELYFFHILNFINVLELNEEKIGNILKDCYFVKELEKDIHKIKKLIEE